MCGFKFINLNDGSQQGQAHEGGGVCEGGGWCEGEGGEKRERERRLRRCEEGTGEDSNKGRGGRCLGEATLCVALSLLI